MANTINLGAYPTGEGTTTEEKSIYIGNNRFVRLLTQSNPDRTIAVLSESSDVFSGTQTLTNVHEQVIINNDYIRYFKMKQLSNGNLLILGGKQSGLGTYLNSAIILTYNDVDGLFEIVGDYDITLGDSDIYNFYEYCFEIYNDDSILVFGNSGSNFMAYVFEGLSTGTITKNRVINDSTADAYFTERSVYTRVIDDNIFLSLSSQSSYQGFAVDMVNKTSIMNRLTYYNSAIKLDTDRYLSIMVDNSAYLRFKIKTSGLETSSLSGSVLFAPLVDLGVSTDDDRMCDIIGLDRQHIIYFYRPENGDSVYALFLKVIDENYGFVSDNSQAGSPAAGNGIFVCNITQNGNNINDYHTGRMINQISPTQFWLQTNTNEFTFLTMSTS